jgi:PAS domain S-box-containing protein
MEWNESLAAHVGFAPAEVPQTVDWWYDHIHPDDRERVVAGIHAVIEGRGSSWSEEYRFLKRDGQYATFLDRGFVARDPSGRAYRMIGSMLDLTERSRAEEELQRAKAEAEHAREVAEAQKRAAEAANHAKDQFLAVLSHELRTPLSPVLSTVQALESETSLPPGLRDSIDMIRRNVELEARLIDDLLDLTRISKGKLELHLSKVDAHETLTTALDICRSDILDKGLRLEVALAATRTHVKADSARLHQVFWNLIKNAVKFTPSGGTIYVTTSNDVDGRSGEAAGGRLLVEVRDTGIGIEPQVLPRIFDAFEQGERSITRKFGGLGLGLAISKALIDMQGGRLDVESAGRGRGATFRVDLAAVTPPVARPGGGGPSAGAAARSDLRILLVDDHLDTALAMRKLLERLGYRITIANTLADALSSYRQQPVDLVISDIGLPDGSGLELIRQLKDLRPVTGIALSGFGMEEDVRKSKEAGFFEHLTKPVNFQRLHALIREATATGAGTSG